MSIRTDAKLQVFEEFLAKAQRLCDENKPFEREAYNALLVLGHEFPHEKVSEAAEGWIMRKQYAIALRYFYFALNADRLKEIPMILPKDDTTLQTLAAIFQPPGEETVIVRTQRPTLRRIVENLQSITMNQTIIACTLYRDLGEASLISDFADQLQAAGKTEEAAVARIEYEL